MDKHYFIELLNKYQKGETTDEENKLLFSYYDVFQSEPAIEALMSPEKKKSLRAG